MPTKLTTTTSRARLKRGTRHSDRLAPGITLVYRRTTDADGTWAMRTQAAPGVDAYKLTTIGLADDVTQADGVRWFNYRQAVEAALAKAKHTQATQLPLTVGDACADYIERRKERGTGRPTDDEAAFRKYLGAMTDRRVAAVDHDVLQAWARRVPRHVAIALRAALNSTPVKVRPTSITLSALKEHRPVKRAGLVESVLSDGEIATVIARARQHDHQFGLFVRLLAATGCRPGQIAKCRKADLLVAENILVVPPSKKGQPNKAKPAARWPLDQLLVRDLSAWVGRKFAKDLIFTLPRNVRDKGDPIGWRVDGERGWERIDWGRAAREAGIDRRVYDLRHAAIVRLLQAGVAIRIVASKCDTSSAIIERHYSRWIGDFSDDLVRKALAYKRLTVVSSRDN